MAKIINKKPIEGTHVEIKNYGRDKFKIIIEQYDQRRDTWQKNTYILDDWMLRLFAQGITDILKARKESFFDFMRTIKCALPADGTKII